MSEQGSKVMFWTLRQKFVDDSVNVEEKSRQVMYYSLAIGHHVEGNRLPQRGTGMPPCRLRALACVTGRWRAQENAGAADVWRNHH